jgi:hypothetical protein
MALQITTAGKEVVLKYLTGNVSATETLKLKLFTNNYTPTPSSIAIDFTEANGGGYAEKLLTASAWTFSNGIATCPAQLWTFTGSVGNVYGYYLIRQTSADVIAAERFTSGPYNIANNGDTITVNLSLNIG